MHIDRATDSLSYWHATEPTLIPRGQLPITANYVIIGAGMLGVWTAYWLAKFGAKPVVLEKTAIGWGATGRNGGFLVGGAAMGYSELVNLLGRSQARDVQALTNEGLNLAHDVVRSEGIACDLRQHGVLSLAIRESSRDAMKQSHTLLTEDGFDAQLLDTAGVQSLLQTPIGPEIVGGMYTPNGGLLHSTRYLGGLARAAARLGARFVRAAATQITGDSVLTDVGTIQAGKVIVALNAWTDEVLPELAGIIVPTRGQILSFAPSKHVFRQAIGTDITPTGEYWQQTPDGSIVIGGCRADAPNKDSDVRDMVHTEDVAAKIAAVLPRLFPQLAGLVVARKWAGLMAFTPDYLPVIDQTEQGILYGGGFNGHGMPFGPIVGKLLAESALSGEMQSALAPMQRNRPSLSPQ